MSNQIIFLLITILLTTSSHAQFCHPGLKLTTPQSRFTISDDGNTTTDTRTGLMWMRCFIGSTLDTQGTQAFSDDQCVLTDNENRTWQETLLAAKTLNDGGGFATFTDWRVPNLNELTSIIEMACNLPSINELAFPDTTGTYWTSTAYNADIKVITFVDGRIATKYTTYNQVRLVRNTN